ncbi:hypothetical protein [Kribbella sp. VKM Ac-2566]|uniref:hypothetical protein n=1 Tax=Kribbella sp. VKM Ac-2566 TaxID=2512218 RepID=UPI0014170AD6|nr:hypothetical protein [Kribbella sp. VKM Ac-2566]
MACLVCSDGPLPTGQLAELARDTTHQLPAVVTEHLTASRWRRTAAATAGPSRWLCCSASA